MSGDPHGDIDSGERHRVLPLMVASLLIPSEQADSKHTPHAMAITLDVDTIPGLREVFNRQRAGEEFDVVSRWGALMDADGTESPLALVDFYLPEVNLGVEIIIDVDRYPDSLLAGVRSGTVYLLDTELSQELQQRDISSAIAEYQPLVIKPPDPKLVVGILQQRHDLPFETYQPEFRDVTPELHNNEVCVFIEGTRLITSYAIQYYPDGSPTILIVESALDEIRKAVQEDAKLKDAGHFSPVRSTMSCASTDLPTGISSVGRSSRPSAEPGPGWRLWPAHRAAYIGGTHQGTATRPSALGARPRPVGLTRRGIRKLLLKLPTDSKT